MKSEVTTMNLYEYIKELSEKGYRIIPIFPRMDDIDYVVSSFEGMQKTQGFADAINYEYTVSDAVPDLKRKNTDEKLKYIHITVSGWNEELFTDHCKKIRDYTKQAGIDKFCNLAYIDNDDKLHFIFNRCDMDGREFTDEDSKAIMSCFS